MSKSQKKYSPLEKEVVDLKKLRIARSHLKKNAALDGWLDDQIMKREAQMQQEKREEAQKYMGKY